MVEASATAVATLPVGGIKLILVYTGPTVAAGPQRPYAIRSADSGLTWSAEVTISDATSGPSYVTPAGFQEPYGEYGELRITPAGKTYATWGEGPNYTGSGGVWVNRIS
jgi:hypothetical protein